MIKGLKADHEWKCHIFVTGRKYCCKFSEGIFDFWHLAIKGIIKGLKMNSQFLGLFWMETSEK